MDLLTRVLPCAAAGVAFGFGPGVAHLAVVVPFALAGGGGAPRAFGCIAAWAGAALLPAGLAALDYTGSPVTAGLAWTVPTAVVTVALGAALAAPRRWRALAVAAAIVAISVPPASTVTFVSPLPVAGLLFPGSGIAGLAGIVALLALVPVARPTRAFAALAGLGLCTAAAAHAASAGASSASRPDVGAPASGIVGMDTRRGMPDAGRAALFGPAWRMEEHDRGAVVGTALGADTVLWPEGAYGEWTPAMGAILAGASVRMIGGARVHVGDDTYVNALVDGATGRVLYAQRRVVPLDVGGAHRAVPGTRLPPDVRPDAGTAPDALLCIELADPWLAATAFAAADGPVLWAANLGWSGRAGLHRRMAATGEQWSALFDVPLVAAVNGPEPEATPAERAARPSDVRGREAG